VVTLSPSSLSIITCSVSLLNNNYVNLIVLLYCFVIIKCNKVKDIKEELDGHGQCARRVIAEAKQRSKSQS
jgi:hypothetical protein